MLTRDNIDLKFIKSMGWANHHHAQYVDEKNGITAETITNKTKVGGFAKPKHFYFINGDEREFLSLDDLIEAYNEKFKFEEENPDQEVIFVKVIRPRSVK